MISNIAKICRAMGYTSLITYILESETGASLKASGFSEDGRVKGRSWSTKKRPRVDKHPLCDKKRFKLELV